MIRRILISIVLAVAYGGCVHYGVETSQTALMAVPSKVTRTFSRNFPSADIKSVWQHTFKGKVVSYEFEYTQDNGQIKKIVVTPKGELGPYDTVRPRD